MFVMDDVGAEGWTSDIFIYIHILYIYIVWLVVIGTTRMIVGTAERDSMEQSRNRRNYKIIRRFELNFLAI